MNDSKFDDLIPDHEALESEAASWISQLDSGKMTTADRRAMREWAARSPRHLEELRKFGEFWANFDAVLEAGLPKSSTQPSVTHFFKAAVRLPTSRIARVAISMTALVLAVVSVAPYFSSRHAIGTNSAVYAVNSGNSRLITLDDGSEIQLDKGSVVEVKYKHDARLVTLVQGQGFFKVAHDKSRPFFVFAAGNMVKAVGTAFEVKIDNGQTSVLVTEGKVDFRPIDDIGRRGLELRGSDDLPLVVAGQSATLSHKARAVKKVTPVSLNKQLSWRKGMLIFEGDPLDQVIKQVGKYSDLSIVIADPKIRNLKIGGAYRAGEIEPFLGALEDSFDIRVDRVDSKTIYLSRAPSLTDKASN